MKRKDFLKAIGVISLAPIIIPSLIGKDVEVNPIIGKFDNPKGLAIDMGKLSRIPNHLSPMEIIRIYEQTGNIVYQKHIIP